MFGAERIFERQFTPREDGYLFYPFAWSRGYLVTEDEYRKLRDDRKRSLSVIGMLRWLLPLVLVVTAVSATLAILLEDERFLTAGNVVLVLVVLTVIYWKSMAATRLIRSREPIAPRRSKVERSRDTARIIGWPMMIFIILLSAWFVVISGVIAYCNPLVGVPVLAFFWLRLRTKHSARMAQVRRRHPFPVALASQAERFHR